MHYTKRSGSFWNKNKKVVRVLIKRLVLFAPFALLVIAALGAVLFFYLSAALPSVTELSSRTISQSTKIYDRTGTILLYEVSGGERRTVVPLQDIPAYLKDATLAIEDEKFYTEPAFDWRGILRALYVNITSGQIRQGGSTITQQLARNAFLTSERTITRKLKEFILAVRLNERYSKDKILELYLNQIPYGPTIYGVEAASEAYFGKSVKDLTLAESAILAALPKAPTYYSPWGSHTKELSGRKKLVLNKMYELGKISVKDKEAALKQKFKFAPQTYGIKSPHFVMAVQDYLVQKYGEDLVQRGGLRVITTLDWDLERAAEKAVADGAAQNEKLYQGKNAALVAEDPKTGQILALVGSRDYFDTQNEGNFDVATQGLRQPGSALKPFVYLTAFEKGYGPDTVLFDAPTEFTSNDQSCPPVPDYKKDNKDCFHPENFDGRFRGPVSLRTALAQSINIPAVKVLYLAGLKDSVKNANDFGLITLTSPNLYGLSLVLGGGAVHLIDLAEAYSVLAQEGVRHAQSLVLEVKDANGAVIESYVDSAAKVSEPQPVRLINNILSDPDARGGLFQNSLSLTVFPEHDVALKTGTSNDYRDAWALGYTPSLVVGVWAGNNDNSPMQKHGSSILAAVPIWSAFMQQALASATPDAFNRPDPVMPAKPALSGDYLHDKQLHTILYYIDKNDPTGPPPKNPEGDPQFTNWETSVLAWAKNNLPDFATYNQPVPPGGATTTITQATPTGGSADSPQPGSQGTAISQAPPSVEIQSPQAGIFVGGQIYVAAKISGTSLTAARIFLNGVLVQEFALDPKSNGYDLKFSFAPQHLDPQNLLEVEAVAQGGASSKSGVVVYTQ